MTKRPRQPRPVEPEEIVDVVLRAILTEFDGRPLPAGVAAHGLSLAAFELNMIAIRAVVEQEVAKHDRT